MCVSPGAGDPPITDIRFEAIQTFRVEGEG